ncbi:16498_t:CDS:2, partial [Racocetra persica]
FQLDGILISKVTDVKIKITDPGAINGNPKIIIKACASIRDIKSVNILTQNDSMRSLIMEFDAGTTLTQIAKALNTNENTYDKLNVPLYDMPLSNLLENIQPEFSLLFYPVTEPPTMDYKLKNIRIFANNFPEIKFIPSQIHKKLTNTAIDISIFNPLEIENIAIGLNIKFYLLITKDKKLLANLSYLYDKKVEPSEPYTLTQYMISIKPQSLDESNITIKLDEILNAIDLYDTFEGLNEFAPILWNSIKNELKSAKFKYLDLYIKNCHSYSDFQLGITISNFIIKAGVIEVKDVTIDLEHYDAKWIGKIKSIAKIIGKVGTYDCFIEYMSPTKNNVGNLLIKNLSEHLTFEMILNIFQLENVFDISEFEDLFKYAKILEIDVDLVNSDNSDFIIEELSIVLWTKNLKLGHLTIDHLKANISYSPSRNNTDSAIWKFSIEGKVDTLVAILSYDNEKCKMQGTLVPTQSKTLKEIVDLLTTAKIAGNSMFNEICDSEIISVNLNINIDMNNIYIEEFSVALMKKLSFAKVNLDDLIFKYKKANNYHIFDTQVNSQQLPSSEIVFALKATISRQVADNKISAMIVIDCDTEYDNELVKAYIEISSFQKPLLLSDFLKLLTGHQPDLQELLPKLPDLPKFENFLIVQGYQYPVTISAKLQITEFRISTQNEESFTLIENPSIKLKPMGVSISYNKAAKVKKYEASLDGIFTLIDGTKLKLVIVKSKVDNDDTIFADIYATENEYSVEISNVVETLLQLNGESDDKWQNRKPKEMKSPNFVVKSTNSEAYLYIHLSKKDVALYVTIESIGNALLLVKKLNAKLSLSVMNILPYATEEKWGYIFALKTFGDFQFEDLFTSSIASNVDMILPLTRGNLVLVSDQNAILNQIEEEANNIIKEFNDKRPDYENLDDIISIKLPLDRKDVYNSTLKQGVNLYSEIKNNQINHNSKYILLENFLATIFPESDLPEIKVASYLGTSDLANSEFKAAISNLILFGGLKFEIITFSYKPSDINYELSKLSIGGKLNFKDLDMDLTVKGKLIIKNKYVLEGKINFSKEIILDGRILFSDGIPHILSIDISQKVGIAHILHTFFGDKLEWPKDLPSITFCCGELYYSNSKEEIKIGEKVYAEGLYAEAHIDFFGLKDLKVFANFNHGKKIELIYVDNDSEINLGFVKLFKFKLSINSKNNSIDAEGFLKLFEITSAEFQFKYDINTQSFKGDVTIKDDKPVLGITNPVITGYWSELNKFMITKWPCVYELSWKPMEFARLIEKASANLSQIIFGLELYETFIGKFTLFLKQLETQSENLISFSLEGNYSIIIESETNKSIPIDNIQISPPIRLDINYPENIDFDNIFEYLLNLFKEKLQENTEILRETLLKDPEKFATFLEGLSIETLIKLKESALVGLVDIAGDKVNDQTRDALKDCVKNILSKMQPKIKLIEDKVRAVEKAQTLSDAVILAGPLLLETGKWFEYLESSINLVTKKLRKLFGDQSQEEICIRKEKTEIDGIDKRIRKTVEKFLTMEGLIPELEFTLENSLKIQWNAPIDAENDKLAVNFHYKLPIIIFGKKTTEKDIIIKKEDIEEDKSDHKKLSYILKDNLFVKCNKVLVKYIMAMLQYDGQTYLGSQSKEGNIEHKPQLYPPTKLKPEYNAHNKILTTEIISEDEDAQEYYCPGGECKIRVLAKADSWKDSEFKYADETIQWMLPPVSVKFRYFYDKNDADCLEILIEETKNQQPLLGYTYQVTNRDHKVIYPLAPNKIKPFKKIPYLKLEEIRKNSETLTAEHFIRVRDVAKEDSNWMDSSYTYSESFKFFSKVNNIRGSYNIDNNVLKVLWDSVENAKKYKISLYVNNYILEIKFTSETFIEFDIWKLEEEKSIERCSTSCKSYTFTVRATNDVLKEDRIDTFDGPVTVIEKDFKQLPKPTKVNMKKESDRLNVSYQPITLTEGLNIFEGYKVNLYDIQKPEKAIAESQIIKKITSSYYDFILKEIKFEEDKDYRAEVHAVVSNDQAINSFPEKSTKTMRSLPFPKNIQIAAKNDKSNEQMFVVSCDFNPKIQTYKLGVENTKTGKTIEKTINIQSQDKINQELSPENSDLLESPSSSEKVEFRAFAQAIGDDDQLDSKIVKSDSTVTQFAAPQKVDFNYSHGIFFGHEFGVNFEKPDEGYYEIQVIQVGNNKCIKKMETDKKSEVVNVKQLDVGVYKVRVRRIPQKSDFTRFISSNWKDSKKSQTITEIKI